MSSLYSFRLAVLWAGLVAALGAAESAVLPALQVPVAAAPGTALDAHLAFLNNGAGETVVHLPETLPGQVIGPGGHWEVTLLPTDNSMYREQRIAAGAFALRTYRATLPRATGLGPATLEVTLPTGERVRAAVEIVARAEAPMELPTVGGTQRPPTTLARARPAADRLRRAFADRLGAHEPIYFIYGPDAPAAKFQFSFKYKIFEFTTLTRERMARTLQFAFTQRSLWDIDGVSSPFYDTSYMPELIFESLAPDPERSDRWFTWLGYQAAFKHESNGRDGPMSRSLNTVYARPVIAFGRLDGWHLLAIPEVFTYVSSLDDNPGLEDYRGYGRLRLVLGRNDGPSLMASLWAGKEFDHGTVQLDLTLPVRTKLLNFETYLLIQYFNGYGESLLSYRDRSETVRAGISLVR